MIKWVPRRVKFAGAEIRSSTRTGEVVSIKLERKGQAFIGRQGNGAGSAADEILHAAQATLEALRQVAGNDTDVQLTAAGPVAALGQSFVLAVVSVTVKGQSHTLMGVCPLSLNPSRDAALAVLDACNRVLGLS